MAILSLGSSTLCHQTLFVVAVFLACGTLTASAQPCPTGHYMAPGDSPGGECKPCSSCPVNQIIRKPCTTYRDNVCGPFYEFEFFNQGQHEAKSMHPSFAVPPSKAPNPASVQAEVANHHESTSSADNHIGGKTKSCYYKSDQQRERGNRQSVGLQSWA